MVVLDIIKESSEAIQQKQNLLLIDNEYNNEMMHRNNDKGDAC
jgi:hypothetical protein